MLKDKEIKKKYWESEYEKVCTALAILEFRLKTLASIPDEEIVGEKEGGRIGTTVAKVNVKAKEVKDETNKEISQKENMKKALEELMKV